MFGPEFVFRKKNALLLDCSYFLLRSKLFNGGNITYSNRNFRLPNVIAKYQGYTTWCKMGKHNLYTTLGARGFSCAFPVSVKSCKQIVILDHLLLYVIILFVLKIDAISYTRFK